MGHTFFGAFTPVWMHRIILAACGIALLLAQGCAVTPEPISFTEHQQRVQEDRAMLYAGQDPLSEPLSLEMSIARALKYNYDNRLAIMETVFHDRELVSASYGMLPKLAANAGYSDRSNESASTSISYETRKVTLEPSVSSEQERRTADLSLSWSVLDFGLSYFQAKQQADRVLIMRERKRRVVNNIVKEVVGAYWKALTADTIMPLVEKTLHETREALLAYETISSERLSPPLETLQQQRDLLNIITQLRRIQADLTMSRFKLAALINIPLHCDFDIAEPDKSQRTLPVFTATIEQLEDKGLAMRPDLREEMYQERIDKRDVHKEILRMMPGVSLFANTNHDSNKFMVHDVWSEVSAKTTMNLLALVTGPMQIQAAQTKVEVTRARRLAQTVAALVQINLSYYQYKQVLEDFNYAKQLSEIENHIVKIALSEQTYEAQGKLSLIKHSVSAVRAQIEHDRIFAEVYQYWGNMFFSLGGDIIPVSFEDEPLQAMAKTARFNIDRWWKGGLPFDDEPATLPEIGPEPEARATAGAKTSFKTQPLTGGLR